MNLEWLKPDYHFEHFTQITVDWLKEKKIKFILSDLDGTLAPQDENGGELFENWYKNLEKNGIGLIIVSNNKQNRVKEFTKKVKIVGYGDCKKPRTKKIEEELFYKGLNPETTIFLGDQIFTDIWCGKKLGIQTILVNPIEGKEPFGIKIKRKLEKTLLIKWGIKK